MTFSAVHSPVFQKIESRQQREEGLAFLCGFISHYIGDSICHPYVYGRIHYDAEHPTAACHGLHAKLENDIDALLLMKYKKKKAVPVQPGGYHLFKWHGNTVYLPFPLLLLK